MPLFYKFNMKTILLTIIFSVTFLYSFSQDSLRKIELQYVTRTRIEHSNSTGQNTSHTTGQMQWKLEGGAWQGLGKKFSAIEPYLKTNPKSAEYLELTKKYRKYYNIAWPVTIAGSLGSLFLFSRLTHNSESFFVNSVLPLGGFVGVALIGKHIILKNRNKSYDYLELACNEYNNRVNKNIGQINSVHFGLGFSAIPMSNNFAPRFSLSFQFK